MEERKLKEIEYYESRAKLVQGEKNKNTKGDFEGFDPLALSSFKFLYSLLKKRILGKIILDYGCGNGIHSTFLIKSGAERVIGIDLSEKSLEIAKEKAKKDGVENKIEFIKMDCEKLDFPDGYFDIILDGGTFSSLDLEKALPELRRVLKPGGVLLGIETFGHNHFTNLKRSFNKLTGKRTSWAAEHIFKEDKMKMVKNYFNETNYYYFHLTSWLAFPFIGSTLGNIFLNFLESIDKVLLKVSFLKKYCFKVVFIFK
ncbi:MAG: class I SAM-dependent methyltransferase [bacterium]